MFSINSYATPSQDAVNSAARAFYEYNHWNEDVNSFLQHYEDKLSPTERKLGGYLAVIANAVYHKEVRFIYRFP